MASTIFRPFGDGLRQHRESIVEKDDVRDRARRAAPALHRDAELRALEPKDVVDAVADHPNVPASGAKRLHNSRLERRLHAADDHRPLDGLAQRGVIHWGQIRPVRGGRLGTVETGFLRDVRDGSRVVSGHDLDGDACRFEGLKGSPRVRADLLPQSRTRQPANTTGAGRGPGLVAQRRAPLREHDDPKAASGQSSTFSLSAGSATSKRRPPAPEHQGLMSGEPRRPPTTAARTRTERHRGWRRTTAFTEEDAPLRSRVRAVQRHLPSASPIRSPGRHLGGKDFDKRREGCLVDPDRQDLAKLEVRR